MKLACRFEVLDDFALDADLEGGAYRLIQEALTNAVRHSGGETVRVNVTTLDGQLMIEVSDDGNGFDRGAGSPGYGLVGMRERVALAGGELKIDSSPEGTAIAACLPLTTSGGAAVGSTPVARLYGGENPDSEGLA